MTILSETRFKHSFELTAVKPGMLVDPKTSACAKGEPVMRRINSIEDLVQFDTEVRFHQLIPLPSLAVQALVLAAEFSGMLVNDENEKIGGGA